MKIALIGNGKTGSAIIPLLPKKNIIEIFNSKNPFNPEKVQNADALIVFVPGMAVPSLIPNIIESKLPTVWGSTGFEWQEDIKSLLIEKKCKWIHAANFSLGMALVRKMLNILSHTNQLIPDAKYHLQETHHLDKKDAPSGTALKWQEWLGNAALDLKIISKREKDVVGIHELKVQSPAETITLGHMAHDRSLFAKGALWATQYLLNNLDNPDFAYGLHNFENIIDHFINESGGKNNEF